MSKRPARVRLRVAGKPPHTHVPKNPIRRRRKAPEQKAEHEPRPDALAPLWTIVVLVFALGAAWAVSR